MTNIERKSPVQFKGRVKQSEVRGGWTVVLAYGEEGHGPHLVDLSHIARWDLQDKDISPMKPLGIEVPDAPGKCHFRDGTLINRMNRTQASIWNLSNPGARMPGDSAYTDLTDATVCLALFGPKAFGVVEKLSALDVLDPGRPAPFLLQGPFAHVPCQLAVLEKGPGADGGLVFTCSRGYAESMVHAVLAAGAEFGLKPAGERRFTDWLAGSGRNG